MVICWWGSISAAGGDKTEAAKGSYDYWLVKIWCLGNVVWQKLTAAVTMTMPPVLNRQPMAAIWLPDIQNHLVQATKRWQDLPIWLLGSGRSNASGTIIWQQVYGSSANDYLTDIAASPEWKYVWSDRLMAVWWRETTASRFDGLLAGEDRSDGNIVPGKLNLGGSKPRFWHVGSGGYHR